MMKLYFENSYGTRRLIAEIEKPTDVGPEITKFINKCNEGKPSEKQFKSYYTRQWINEDGEYVWDVGSHSEFFIGVE